MAEGRNRTQWQRHFIPIKVLLSKLLPRQILPKQHPRLCTNLAGKLNARYVWLSGSSINCLHIVQNAAALVHINTSTFSLILISLHWLLIHSRIHIKILLFASESLNGLAPPDLSDLIHLYVPTCPLRSAEELKAQRGSCFSCYGSKIIEPQLIRQASFISDFKSFLKTHLFSLAFDTLREIDLICCTILVCFMMF